ncbi:MAG: hypothetical protein IKW11_09420 [Bacteroidales bacterium]|nr:hypothetical protein [Bacteroidales bacterium]
MKRHFMIFSAALAAMVSCHKEPVQQPLREDVREVTIEAGTLSKTVLKGDKVWWEGGDEIALVFRHPDNAPHVNRTFVNQEAEQATERAIFKGQIPGDVTTAAGYSDWGFAVYPKIAITDEGDFVHNLPAEQVAMNNGSFPSGYNLSSASISLSELGGKSSAKTDFKCALSVLRIALTPDVESVTLTGTASLAGCAPLQMYYDASDLDNIDNGRLLVDSNAAWTEESKSVTLKPADGTAFENKTYNILVWPGKQVGLTITLKFKSLGEYEKTSSISTLNPVTFKPAKYYNLNVVNSEELLVEDVTDRLEDLEQNLPNLDDAEADVEALLAQVQSVTLMTEYLGNSVYAPYGIFNNGMHKLDVSLDYIVKPESAAQVLVNAFQSDPSVAKGILGYRKSIGFEVAGDLKVNDLTLSDAPFGKYVTVNVSAENISRDFYDGKYGASIALQIASGKTEILSEFANLVPKAGSAFSGSYLNDIPVIPGSRVVIPFSFAVSDASASYSLKVVETEKVDWATANYDASLRTGNLSVQLNPSYAVESQKVTLELSVGSGDNAEVVQQEFTFVNSGSNIEFSDPGQVDYIGGDIALEVITTNINNYMLSCSGAGVSQSGNIFTFSENSGAQRSVTVECQATISGVSLNYYKSITLIQKAYGTSLSKVYYANGQKVALNQANAPDCPDYFNIVILGDGYKKKDLAVGGKFERSARSAMDTFFAIEPYKTFMNRFNVYMASYESAEEGTDVRSAGITKDTYFNTYCQGGGNTASYVSDATPVINAVKAVVGNGDAQYYRTIAIVLVNTDEQAGSTGYPFRDYKSGFVNGYASFAIAVLAANSTGTNGLVKHEAGGHAFGRLADEYFNSGSTASSSNKADLSNWHAKGWYWNVNPSNTGDYYMFTNSAYSSSEVSFIEGGWGYGYGVYRSTQGGMMQGNTGVFNAPSRHAIYHRIITESEGSSAYSWSRFLEYDQINR